MKDLSRALRFWLFLPIVFISLAAVVVTAVISFRAWQFEKEVRLAQKQAIESHIYGESAKIAEEIYLNLDNWSAREKQLATFFRGHDAKIRLRFEPKVGDGLRTPSDGSQFVWRMNVDDASQEVLIGPLFFGDVFLGDLFVDLTWGGGWSLGGIGNVTTLIFGALTILIFGWFLTFITFRKSVFYPLLERMVRLNRLEAISETTQMIAHDIRKPFHMLRLCLQALQKITDPEEIRSLAEVSAITVDRVSNEVEDMLTDIVDLERPDKLQIEETSMASLIEAVVADYRNLQDEKDCLLTCHLDHSFLALIDKHRIQRVLGNLLRNAFQAVERGGRIWIRTEDSTGSGRKKKYVTVTIGNSGATIDAKDLPQLFDRFFTKGKADGTGLGLAIAKKFVSGQGGEIWCDSSVDRGTEFHFTVPARFSDGGERPVQRSDDWSQIDDLNRQSLPASQQYRQDHRASAVQQESSSANIVGVAPVHVALLGDDRFYLDAMTSLLETFADPTGIRATVVAVLASGISEVSESDLAGAELIIVDWDEASCNEAAMAQLLPLIGSGVIWVHNGGNLVKTSMSQSTPFEYLSKPMDSTKIEGLLRKASAQRIR
jgi:signal transduction histidine kinase